jgi:ribonuclease HI
MNQLSLFDAPSTASSSVAWKLYIDGAARNNPGPAGAGVYILKNDTPLLHKSYFLGDKTNNQAEYYALLLGLFVLDHLMQPGDTLTIFSDSQLLVRQIAGHYRIKDVRLKELYAHAQCFLQNKCYTIHHILRAENGVADQLANEGIDKKSELPDSFIKRVSI